MEGGYTETNSYLTYCRGLVLWTMTSQMGQYLVVSKYLVMHVLQTENNKSSFEN